MTTENKPIVAILTNFMDFSPGYSLTGISQNQCKMLQDNGHPVKLFVNSQYNRSDRDKFQFTHNVSRELPPVELHKTIPFTHLIDYSSVGDLTDEHKKIVQKTKEMLLKELDGVRYVFTHDFLFTGWFLPYGLGVIEAAKELPDTYFYHWIHSTPSTNRDWWDFNKWGKNHKIIFPNKTERVRVAEQYRTVPINVGCIHHIMDLRTWNDFCKDSNDFVHDYPGLMWADIVQVYPISTDRLEAKGLKIVIKVFAWLKTMGYSVCLVVANQWATGRQRREDVRIYNEMAVDAGLDISKEFIFTSLWNDGKYDTGIPKRMLRDLMSYSNLFLFPTREESFGLIGPEVALSTSALVITNKSLQMMSEIHGGITDSYDFGSFTHSFSFEDMNNYLKDIAILIHSSLRQRNFSVLHRSFIRQKYNWNRLYFYEYLPLFSPDNFQ